MTVLFQEQGLPWCGRNPREWQPEALAAIRDAWRKGEHPLIQAATGSGKSLLLCEIAAQGRGSVLVTTPTQALVEQLYVDMSRRLPGEVGRAFQHCWETDKRVVVVCTPSLRKLLAERQEWGCWIADEAHRMESEALRSLTGSIRSKVRVGLTATPFRADKRGMQNWTGQAYGYPSARAVADGVLVPFRAVRWDGKGDPTTDDLVQQWVLEADGPGIVSAMSIRDAEMFAARLGPRAAAIHDEHNKLERTRRIEQLRTGELKCLVHVALLTEGVDLPWLRWLAMRRPVGSIVRLVQEVGRVLRAAEGKREAVLYDPYNLLGELGLTHAEAMEDALEREAAQKGAPEEWMIPGFGDLGSELPDPVKVQIHEGWVIDIIGACRAYKLLPPMTVVEGTANSVVMRRGERQPATDRQYAELQKLTRWALFPEERHRQIFNAFAQRDDLTRTTAQNMIGILKAFRDASAILRRSGGRWRPPFAIPEIRVPEEWAA